MRELAAALIEIHKGSVHKGGWARKAGSGRRELAKSHTLTPVSGKASHFDGVVIIGSGPNGLAAAIALLQQGIAVQIYEAHPRVGGGLLCSRATLPDFLHDHCAAVHPMGVLSPFLSTLDLAKYGLVWRYPDLSAAHPLDGGKAAILARSVEETAAELGEDAAAYRRLVAPYLKAGPGLLADLLAPLGLPKDPLTMMRFGLRGIASAKGLANRVFRGELAKALFAGCAAHSILPMEAPLSAALGLLFCVTGHWTDWPVVQGGSEQLAIAMQRMIVELGGEIFVERRINSLADLPQARAYLFDTSPKVLLDVAGDKLSSSYRKKLERYRYGPGVYKIDYALREAIPWTHAACGKASTVHLGGTMDEIAVSERAMWEGKLSERPFVMLCQQSHFDNSRAPAGQHTGYAYLHVPFGYKGDARYLIEQQIERFAPGFRDCVLASHVTTPADFERQNPAFFGGTVTGGVADWRQAFARPVLKRDPYRTSHPQIYIGSAASPPGGGVHGMGGFHAAQSILRAWGRSRPAVAAPKRELAAEL